MKPLILKGEVSGKLRRKDKVLSVGILLDNLKDFGYRNPFLLIDLDALPLWFDKKIKLGRRVKIIFERIELKAKKSAVKG